MRAVNITTDHVGDCMALLLESSIAAAVNQSLGSTPYQILSLAKLATNSITKIAKLWTHFIITKKLTTHVHQPPLMQTVTCLK